MKGKHIWLVYTLAAIAAVFVAAAPARPADTAIYPGDTLRITVLGEEDLTRQVLVDASGKISLPLIGEITVAGKTAAAAASEISEALKKYIKRPQVTLEVALPAKRNVAITGAIKTAGLYPINPTTRLADLVSLAGGHLPNADLANVTVTKAETRETVTCNLQEFYAGRNPEGNLLLQDGDSIMVPELGTVLVLGQVRTPGLVQMSANTTVRQVVERAGGLTEQADTTKVILKRADSGQPTTLDLVKALQGDPAADVTLNRGDEITVPALTQVGKFTITTGVRNPGQYSIVGDPYYVTDAISQAGGTTSLARLSRVTILRSGQSIHVDVGAVYAGKTQNVAILPGDSISIGEGSPKQDPIRWLGTAALLFRYLFR